MEQHQHQQQQQQQQQQFQEHRMSAGPAAAMTGSIGFMS
jgi:hypothetical protein